MRKEELTKDILLVASGDELARERLINHYKPYIINAVGHVCKRYITWHDEESSIGLIAFNRAMDTYDVNASKSFLNYVYLLIKRELINYFRRESKENHIPLEVHSAEDATSIHTHEVRESLSAYQQNVQQKDLIEEILELRQALNKFTIDFEELEYYSPKHRKTRAKLLKIADDLVQSTELIETFNKSNRLPVTALTKKFGHRTKTLENHRKYIVTLVLLKLHPEWKQLSAYIQVPLGSEEK